VKPHASNPFGEATQQLLLLAIDRILEDHATKDQQEKVLLALRDDSISPGVDGCVVGHLELLHDYAENRAYELINQLLATGEAD
jgi:hypothetical protein